MHSPRESHGSLPEHIRRDPAFMDWRLSDLERRVCELEERPTLSLPEHFPWGRAAVLLFLLIAGLKGHIAPETAASIAGKLLGLGLP